MTSATATPTLAQLQTRFAAALRYEEQGEHCSIQPGTFSPEQQLQIYRNNFIVSLSEVLGATYPVVLQLIGETCFAQLARRHVLSFPLMEGNVWGYGRGFALTIQQTEPVIAAVPYLAEVARLEWALDELRRQAYPPQSQAPCQSLDSLHSVDSEQHHLIHLHCLGSMLLFESDFAVFSIRDAVLNHSFDDVEPGQPEYGAMIYSAGRSEPVRITRLSHPQKQLIQHIQQQKCLGEIEPALLAELNALVQRGLIIGFTLGDHQYAH